MIVLLTPAVPQLYTPLRKHAHALLGLEAELHIICLKKQGLPWPAWTNCHFYGAGTFPARSPIGFLSLMYMNTRLLFKLKPDVIEAVDPPSLIPAAIYRIFHPCILGYFSMEWFTQTAALTHKPLHRYFWKILETWAVKKCEFAFTVNGTLARILGQYWQPVPVYTVRNLTFLDKSHLQTGPVPTSKATLPKDNPRLNLQKVCRTTNPVYIYHGVFENGRGLLQILSAFAHFPHLHLALVGYGPLEHEVIRQASNLPNAHYLGVYSTDELELLLPQAWAGFVYIEPFAPSQRNSLPGKLFDCVQAGIPIIGSPLPEIESHIHTYNLGTVTADFSQNSLLQAIRYMEDPQKRLEHITALQTAKTELCWEKEERLLCEPFQKVQSLYGSKKYRKPQRHL